MDLKNGNLRFRLLLSLVVTLVIGVTIVFAQGELIPRRDITGGTSIFVFPSQQKSVSQRYATQARSTRTQQQRQETARRVTRQFTTLSKAAPRRTRSAEVEPDKLGEINRMEPEEASIRFAGVGEYHIARESYDLAIEFFREAIQLDETNTRAEMGLSEALALKGNELLAKDAANLAKLFFEEAVKLNDKNGPAYFGLGELYSDEGAEDAARRNYELALSNDAELTEIYVPLGILYYRAANYDRADDLLTKAVAADPNNAQAQFFFGAVRLQKGDTKTAEVAFRQAKTIDDNYVEAFYYSGEALSRLGRTDDALVDLERAIALRENYFEAWFAKGSALFELERYKEATEAYERAKRLRNDNAEVVANLGDTYRILGEYNMAESNYNLAALFIEREDDFATNNDKRELAADIYTRLAYAISSQCEINAKRLVPCKWDTAVEALEKSAKLSPRFADGSNVGWAYYNAGKSDLTANRDAQGRAKLEQARDNLVAAIAKNPKNVEGPLFNLAVVYVALGDDRNAMTTLQRVVKQEPKWVFAVNELGLAYMRQNNLRDAIRQFKAAVERDGNYAEAYLNLGHAEFKNGNINEARKAHAKLRSLGRNDLATRLEQLTGGAVRG
jgi:tetratricopeptide (TPR) repeat protein